LRSLVPFHLSIDGGGERRPPSSNLPPLPGDGLLRRGSAQPAKSDIDGGVQSCKSMMFCRLWLIEGEVIGVSWWKG
jgi:hypothetical protein